MAGGNTRVQKCTPSHEQAVSYLDLPTYVSFSAHLGGTVQLTLLPAAFLWREADAVQLFPPRWQQRSQEISETSLCLHLSRGHFTRLCRTHSQNSHDSLSVCGDNSVLLPHWPQFLFPLRRRREVVAYSISKCTCGPYWMISKCNLFSESN